MQACPGWLEETAKILHHLIKTGKSPPGFDSNSLN
jgi:hypothetical protein